MKYDLSNIMRNAWNLKKTYDVSMSVALRSAWALEKAMMSAEEAEKNPSGTTALLQMIGSRVVVTAPM